MQKYEEQGKILAVVESSTPVITDAQSALDLLMEAKYDLGTKSLIVAKTAVCEDFFILSTGVAGEILQKIINYGGKIAIYGDFTRYTSKPLHDFLYESNRGRDVFFTATREQAIEKLLANT